MSSQPTQPKDFWTSETYGKKVAPFVSQLTEKVVEWLDPKPDDAVLDIGCGDGALTARLAARVASITGIDASANMISALQTAHPSVPSYVLDCSDPRTFRAAASAPSPPSVRGQLPSPLHPQSYTSLFSNAALHWILRPPGARPSFFQTCFDLLQPGGRFVSESGALGNVAEVHAAIWHELASNRRKADGSRIAHEDLAAVDPWFFPALDEMRALVEGAGFVWVRGEVELRQTRLTDGEEGGVGGWLRLFGDPFSQLLPGGREGGEWQSALESMARTLERVGRRADGGFQLNYVRLRFEARRPET